MLRIIDLASVVAEILFFTFLVAIFAFMINRLYVGLRYGELNVRSTVFCTRQGTPVLYWAVVPGLMIGVPILFVIIFSFLTLFLS